MISLFGTSLCHTLFIATSNQLNVGSVGRSFAYMTAIAVLQALVAVCFGGMNIQDLKMTLTGWVSILYLGFPYTLITISLYLKGLSVIILSESAMPLLLQILAGLILASSLLEEFLSLLQTIEAVAILFALVLGVKRASGRNEPSSEDT